MNNIPYTLAIVKSGKRFKVTIIPPNSQKVITKDNLKEYKIDFIIKEYELDFGINYVYSSETIEEIIKYL